APARPGGRTAPDRTRAPSRRRLPRLDPTDGPDGAAAGEPMAPRRVLAGGLRAPAPYAFRRGRALRTAAPANSTAPASPAPGHPRAAQAALLSAAGLAPARNASDGRGDGGGDRDLQERPRPRERACRRLRSAPSVR